MSTLVVKKQEARPRSPATQALRRVWSSYFLRRLLVALAKIWFVVTLTFFIVRLMPTNPIEAYINEVMLHYGFGYQEARQQASAMLAIDLDKPVILQYFDYMGGLLQGDLGTSYRSQGTPVVAIIARFLPWTLFSVGISLAISFTIGILLGMIMAYRRESILDHALSAFASILSSVPNYLLGMMLLVLLGVQMELFSVSKMRGSFTQGIQPGFTWVFIKDIFYHATLPVITYVLTTIGGWMLSMKSSTISTLGEDYVTIAKARGLTERRIVTAYVGRNASLPLFTQLAITIGFVVGGSILIEHIFVYQGVGVLLLNSINHRDYPLMQGVFLIITTAVIMANLLADYVYRWLDPRIGRRGGK